MKSLTRIGLSAAFLLTSTLSLVQSSSPTFAYPCSDSPYEECHDEESEPKEDSPEDDDDDILDRYLNLKTNTKQI